MDGDGSATAGSQMSVYVDSAIHTLRGRLMCHMLSPDLAELHGMAERIGMQRRWFQYPLTMRVSWPHYDIDEAYRSLAVSLGAIVCDQYQTVAMAAIHPGQARQVAAHSHLGRSKPRLRTSSPRSGMADRARAFPSLELGKTRLTAAAQKAAVRGLRFVRDERPFVHRSGTCTT